MYKAAMSGQPQHRRAKRSLDRPARAAGRDRLAGASPLTPPSRRGAICRSRRWCATAWRSTVSSLAHRSLAVAPSMSSLYIAVVALSIAGRDLPDDRRRLPVRRWRSARRRRSSAPRSARPSSSWSRAPRSASLCSRRAGPRAGKLAEGFRADAFSYLLFLRLVPAFPFFLVNLVPAFAGVQLAPFVAATALGIIPGALAFAFAGTGLDSVIAAQKAAYRRCLAAGRADCQLDFNAAGILTPQLLGALIALGAAGPAAGRGQALARAPRARASRY